MIDFSCWDGGMTGADEKVLRTGTGMRESMNGSLIEQLGMQHEYFIFLRIISEGAPMRLETWVEALRS